MEAIQSRMARAGLGWSLSDLAAAANVGRATVARFELGQSVAVETVNALRMAFEGAGIRLVDTKGYIGASVAINSAKSWPMQKGVG